VATSLYAPGDSPVHRLHPLTKLAIALCAAVAAFALPGLAAGPLVWLCALLPLALMAGVGGRFLGLSLRALLPIAISVFLIQSLLYPVPNPTPLRLGPITLRLEGVQFATLISGRLLALTSATLLVLLTTHPADLVFALTEAGVPRSIGYILLVSLQLLPYMQGRATAIIEAQRSRGLETQGGLVRRARGLVPLAGPLVIGALSEVEERAVALELRAFMSQGPKTSLRLLYDSPWQRVLRVVLILAALGLIVWRVAAWVRG
jgi:energy-coupling factor transport system permease protein